MASTTMKAVIARPARPEATTNRPVVSVTKAHPIPQPAPNSSEILVKVLASPIQPSDLLNSRGGFPQTEFPRVLGRDFSGTVVAPPSSSLFEKHVYGTSGPDGSFTRDGAHAEYVLLPSESAVAVFPSDSVSPSSRSAPEGKGASKEEEEEEKEEEEEEKKQRWNPKVASLTGVPWTTAYLALLKTEVKSGDVVMVIGAGGQVGDALVQLARDIVNSPLRDGSRVEPSTDIDTATATATATDAHPGSVITVGRGSRYSISTLADPTLSTARELTGGKGPDVVVDTTGDVTLMGAALDVLAVGGRLGVITTGASRAKNTSEESHVSEETDRVNRGILSVDLHRLYRNEQRIVGCNSVSHSAEEMAGWMAEMGRAFQEGRLNPPKLEGYTQIKIDDATDAYSKMDGGSEGGKDKPPTREKFLIVF